MTGAGTGVCTLFKTFFGLGADTGTCRGSCGHKSPLSATSGLGFATRLGFEVVGIPLLVGSFILGIGTGVGLGKAGRSAADDGRRDGSKGRTRLGGRSYESAGVEAGRCEVDGTQNGSVKAGSSCPDNDGGKNEDDDTRREFAPTRSLSA